MERRYEKMYEGRKRKNVKNELKGKKGNKIQKFTETRKGLLKSRILKDGKDLRIKI
jgi:hypothetical protein